MSVTPVRRRARQWLLFVHVVVSLGWMGGGAANVVLAVTAVVTSSAEVQRVCYYLINRIDFALVIPLAFSALASGVVISLATKWGLFRYWWVIAKLTLTVGVIVFSTFGVGVWVEESILATVAGDPDNPAALPLIYGAGANIVAFLFMTWASIVKPWGKVPRAAVRAGASGVRSTGGPAR